MYWFDGTSECRDTIYQILLGTRFRDIGPSDSVSVGDTDDYLEETKLGCPDDPFLDSGPETFLIIVGDGMDHNELTCERTYDMVLERTVILPYLEYVPIVYNF